MLSRDTSYEKNKIYTWKIREKETAKRKKVIESDQTSLLTTEGKHIGEIKYKILLAEKKV